MSNLRNENGSHIVAFALGILLLGLIGFAGWRILHKSDSNKSDSSVTTSVEPLTADSIKSKSDLSTAKSKLEALDADTAKIDSDVNTLSN